jgi:hypothetical protein
LIFANAAVELDYARVPRGYVAEWSTFDNTTQRTERFAETSSASTVVAAPPSLPRGESAFVKVDISAVGSVHTSWARPVSAYFRHDHGGWKLVGLERIGE